MLNQRRLRTAVALHRQGRLAEAALAYDRLHEINPDDADLWHLRGLMAGDQGDPERAARFIAQAIRKRPDVPFYHWNLGLTLERLDRLAEAVDVYNALGNRLQLARSFDDAAEAYRKGLHLDPDNAFMMSNLAAVLNHLGHYEVAIDWLERAIGFQPDEATIYVNLGNAFVGLGWLDRALGCYERAQHHEPDLPEAHWARGQVLLLLGHFAEGWREYEWRLRWAGYDDPFAGLGLRVWQGEPADQLAGELLLLSEQGFGDTLQFIRYAALLAGRGYRVIVEVREELLGLAAASFPEIKLLGRNAALAALRDRTLQPVAAVHLLSLPYFLGTAPETIPAAIPYLSVASDLTERWRRRLGRNGGHRKTSPKIGIVWAGRHDHAADHARSLPPDLLAPLLNRPDAVFYSLQKDVPVPVELAGTLVDLGSELTDFSQTAACLQNLDLLIGVDTSVMHLAGGLGLPAWLLLSATPDWRWGQFGDSSVWYPTLRLFRQPRRRDWGSVIETVRNDLNYFIGTKQ